jgi:hypothetical protein
MEAVFDFDDSSDCWRKNKIYIGKGYFQYKCKKENCNESLYCYTTQHKMFFQFASDFDLKNRNNPNQFDFCETHLFENS